MSVSALCNPVVPTYSAQFAVGDSSNMYIYIYIHSSFGRVGSQSKVEHGMVHSWSFTERWKADTLESDSKPEVSKSTKLERWEDPPLVEILGRMDNYIL